MFRMIPVAAIAATTLLLGACSGGGGSTSSSDDRNSASAFARFDCNLVAQGPIAGPLDDAQAALIEQTAAALAGNPEFGASGEAIVIGVARLLDLVDGLAATSTVLFTEQDPQAAANELLGVSQAVQCAAASLANAAAESPLRTNPLALQLIRDLEALALAFDVQDPNFIGADGLETLTAQLGIIADTLGDITRVPAVDFAGAPDGVTELLALTADLFDDLAITLASVSELDGQASADQISATVTGVLGNLLAILPDNAAAEPLMQAQAAIADGLSQILVPLFDAIAAQLDAGGMSGGFGGFLSGGFTGTDTPVSAVIGGDAGLTNGVLLGDQLAGVPVLGDLIGLLLAAGGEGGDSGDNGPLGGAALITDLINGQGPDGAPDLAAALSQFATQLQALAPDGVALPAPGDGNPLTTLLGVLADNPVADLLSQLGDALGGDGVPSAAGPADIADAISGLLSGLQSSPASGGLAGLLDTVVGLLTDNPLGEIVTGLLNGGTGELPGPELLTEGLQTLLGALQGVGNNG